MRVTKNAFFGAAAALIRHPAGHFCGTLGAYRERRILYRGVDFAEKAERRARGAVRAVVYYRPKDRMLSTARGTLTGLMPGLEGQQPEYRIKHFSEDFERVAFEKELSAE